MSTIEHIVFSGGSTKAIAYCGALLELHDRKILYDSTGKLKIKSFAGTSAGSIIASLVAIGFMPDELCTTMKAMDFTALFYNETYLEELYDLVEYIGANSGSAFYEFLGKLIQAKTGNKDYTIQQLFDEKAVTLVIVATDLNCQKTVYFYPNHPNELYQNLPIRLAIRMSMSIPGFFSPVIFNKNYHIDGGILNNYPIHVFDGTTPDDEAAYIGDCEPNTNVLGLNIITDHDMAVCKGVDREDITGWTTFLPLLINVCLIDNLRKELTTRDLKRTIIIDTPNISPINFDITDEQKNELIEIGKKAVATHFS
jgi:NTE family protein